MAPQPHGATRSIWKRRPRRARDVGSAQCQPVAGKIADLVLLDQDPLLDIHNTRTIQAIVLNGKLMKRAALDAMLTEAEAAAAK